MGEVEVSTASGVVNTPESLKHLVSNVESFGGNNLLHQIVLDNSLPNNSVSQRCLRAVLLSICSSAVNELNDDGYSPLHLAVLKENVLMVKMLLSCLRNIDANAKCDTPDKYENTALHLAAELGNASLIGELLKKGVDVNVKNLAGQAPLHLAIIYCHLETVKFLVEKGAKVNAVADNGYDSLRYVMGFDRPKYESAQIFKWLMHTDCYLNTSREYFNTLINEAASYGNADIVEMLVESRADVNAGDIYSSSLHSAILSGDFKTIECLVRNGSNVRAIRRTGETVLHYAGRFCDFATFKFLFDKINHAIKSDPTQLQQAEGSDNLANETLLVNMNDVVNTKDKRGSVPLHQALLLGNLETVKFLLNANADVNAVDDDGKTVLNYAVRTGNLCVIKLLLSTGAVLDAENKNFPLLCCAARSNDLETLEFILDQSPDVNVQDMHGRTPMYYAVRKNHIQVIKALLDRGANLNAMNTDHNPLHVAVQYKRTEAAQTLLARGSLVNAMDESGYTPLICALEECDVMFDSDIVRLLIKWGADINASPCGNTALHYACQMSHFKPDMFHLLVDGSVCATNDRGLTPLHFAAWNNNVVALRLLVEKGADLNAKDVDGNTPLHYAAEWGNAKFARALLKRGVNVDVKGKDGQTPLHHAAIWGRADTVEALVQRGADVNAVDDFGKTQLDYEQEVCEGSHGLKMLALKLE